MRPMFDQLSGNGFQGVRNPGCWNVRLRLPSPLPSKTLTPGVGCARVAAATLSTISCLIFPRSRHSRCCATPSQASIVWRLSTMSITNVPQTEISHPRLVGFSSAVPMAPHIRGGTDGSNQAPLIRVERRRESTPGGSTAASLLQTLSTRTCRSASKLCSDALSQCDQIQNLFLYQPCRIKIEVHFGRRHLITPRQAFVLPSCDEALALVRT